MKPYDPKQDYCGPGKGWLAKVTPDKPLGANIGFCCYSHDGAYERGGTGKDRAAADERLRDCVYRRQVAKWWIPKFVARRVARRYYEAVRIFGSSCFNYHD